MSRHTRFSAPLAAILRIAGAPFPAPSPQPPTPRPAFTLVEMLVAMAITLVMMAAVVTLFANVSNSVRNRRATIEMSSQIRHVRNVLQQDLLGATCPGLPWQRSESNHGYIELIEGQYREGNASLLVDTIDAPSVSPPNPEIDHTTSILPSGNLPISDPTWITDGSGLGDADDILMLTVRNEHEPFVGRMPAFNAPKNFPNWTSRTVESPLAEVVWFAIENPTADESADRFFGEPGMRTIYRRTLLIAPWVNPYQDYLDSTPADEQTIDDGRLLIKPEPGLVRVLRNSVNQANIAEALAALVAFQGRYDLSVRVEFDPKIERWKIMANTLSDLTKRENRFGHFGFRPGALERQFPYAIISAGSGYSGSAQLRFTIDNEFSPPTNDAEGQANITTVSGLNGVAASYSVEPDNYTPPQDQDRRYKGVRPTEVVRPFVYVDDNPSGAVATAQAILNDDGEVVRVVHGPVPLCGTRRGEDVMMTDALAFDVRVFDPGAPIFQHSASNAVLEPSDPAWVTAYLSRDNMDNGSASGAIGKGNTTSSPEFPYVGQGAFVDLGYGYAPKRTPPGLPTPIYNALPAGSSTDYSSSAVPWFFRPKAISDVKGNQLAPGFAVYDTWSFHYENNGRDDDGDGSVDQGTNGLDNVGVYPILNPSPPPDYLYPTDTRLGIDDVGERETAPPYDRPLRGMQVILRAYERDSRAIRQVRVTQHLMPE